jgi:hypothetical protein
MPSLLKGKLLLAPYRFLGALYEKIKIFLFVIYAIDGVPILSHGCIKNSDFSHASEIIPMAPYVYSTSVT